MGEGDWTKAIIAMATSVVSLATVAVLVSNKSQTSSVLGAAFSGYASVLNAAVSPVTGGGSSGGVATTQGNTQFPQGMFGAIN